MDCNFCPADNHQAMYEAPVFLAGRWFLASLCLWHLAQYGDQAHANPIMAGAR